jgi:hypothetical protein
VAKNNILNALNSLAEQVPGLNQRALKQVQAARDIGLQRQIQAAPTRQPAAPQAQALATQQALQAGQDIVAQRQQAAARAQQIRGATLQEKQRLTQQGLRERELAQQQQLEQQRIQQLNQLRSEELRSRKTILDNEIAASTRLQDLGIEQDNKLQIATIKQREDLARLGRNIKGELIDSRLQFQKDERGRKFSNERQLADYIASTAENRQDLNAKLSQMKQMHDRKILLMKQSQAQLETALERGFLKEQDDLDFQAKKELAQLKVNIENEIRREEAIAKNKQAMYQAGGTIVGAAVGTLAGPAGTAAGAAIGGAAGSIIGGLV